MAKKSISVTDVLRDLNKTTIFITPLFTELASKLKSRGPSPVEIPVMLLLFEHGLVKSYLNYEDDIPTDVYLRFNAKVYENLKLVHGVFNSMNERLIESEYCEDVIKDEEGTWYKFRIPDRWEEDVLAISESRYDDVSKRYRLATIIRQPQVPKWENPYGKFIVTNNWPCALILKSAPSRKLLEEATGVSIDPDSRLISEFDRKVEDINNFKIFDDEY